MRKMISNILSVGLGLGLAASVNAQDAQSPQELLRLVEQGRALSIIEIDRRNGFRRLAQALTHILEEIPLRWMLIVEEFELCGACVLAVRTVRHEIVLCWEIYLRARSAVDECECNRSTR